MTDLQMCFWILGSGCLVILCVGIMLGWALRGLIERRRRKPRGPVHTYHAWRGVSNPSDPWVESPDGIATLTIDRRNA